MVKYNPLDIGCKSPRGAVATNQKISVRIKIDAQVDAKSVYLVLRKQQIICFELRNDGENVFSIDFSLIEEGVYYYRFEVRTDDGVLFVGRDKGLNAVVGDWLPEWQLTVYKRNYKTPEWIKGSIIYHIFPDRFCRVEDNGAPLRGYLKSWEDELTISDEDGVYRANDFYGGNILGIISKLDYLKELSVGAIYLSPIFMSASNHRYDIADYLEIDPLFGTIEQFERLVSECKRRDMYLILDGVFNHTGADSVYFNKFGHFDSIGACQSKQSRYYDWFNFTRYPNEYDCWWGVTVVPSVKKNCKDFQNFIAGKGGVLEKWSKLGVKGWRLDVVDELSDDFVVKIRKRLKRIDKDSLLIGEVWEDASTKVSYSQKRAYLFGEQLDGVMNYPFKDYILGYVKNANAEAFVNQVNQIVENYPKASLDVSMTLIGTHDTVRVLNELSGAKGGSDKKDRLAYRLTKDEREKGKELLKIASTLAYFLPGVPVIYYGDEVGLEGFEDPINRRPMPRNKDAEIFKHYKRLGEIRNGNRSDFVGEIEIKALSQSVVLLKRDKLSLIINPTKTVFVLPKPQKDIISGEMVSEISQKAVIFVNK